VDYQLSVLSSLWLATYKEYAEHAAIPSMSASIFYTQHPKTTNKYKKLEVGYCFNKKRFYFHAVKKN
jgi:hypothetical protein